MKRVYKIIIFFIVIFVIGVVVFVSSINRNLDNETNTKTENIMDSSQKVTLQHVVFRKIA